MRGHLHGDDLARRIHRDFHGERLEARHVVGLGSGLVGSGRSLTGSPRCGSLSKRVVHGIRGQRRARLGIQLRGGDVLTHQRGQVLSLQHLAANARRLVVAVSTHGSNLAILIDGDHHRERLEARHVVARRGHAGGNSLIHSRSRGSSLLKRVVDRVAGQRHAGLHVDLSGGDVLTHQRVEHGSVLDQRSAKTRRLAMRGHLHGDDLARVIHRDLHGERLEAGDLINRRARLLGRLCFHSRGGLHIRFLILDGKAVRGSSLLERVVDRRAGQRHTSLHVDLRRGGILTNDGGKSILRQQIRSKARRLVVLIDGDGSNLAILHRDVHRELVKALDGIRIGRHLRTSLTQCIVDGIAGQRRAGLHVDASRRDVLTHQRIKHGGVSDQVSTEARRLVVLRHGDGDDLAVFVHSDLNLERLEAGHIVGRGGHNRLGRLTCSGSCGSQHGVLVARVRLDAQRALRIGQHVGHGVHKRGRGNRRAAQRVHVVTERIRVSRNRDKLILELALAHAAAQTRGLLQRANVHLRHIALRAYAEGDRDFSAVALRRSGQRVALNLAANLADEQLVQNAVLGNPFIFNLLVFAAREHRVQRFHLGCELLILDRPLRHFIGDSQSHGGDKREGEQTNRQFDDVTHSS